ncbi:MAG: hypothetical protein CNCCGFBP_02462 [Fimbriimonadaceae bacterium]|nr:hypothetical protein [Fimbriimonadaceae bacterium]
MAVRHKCFISYHHANDQSYRDSLVRWSDENGIFIDASVDSGDIDDSLTDQRIREKIRDEYLRDSTVTILLCGTETKNRKHIDWELYSSMFDGSVNKKSGILVVNLPVVGETYFHAGHGQQEKSALYSSTTTWVNIDTRSEYERRYPYMPARLIDNLLVNTAKISVVNWSHLTDPSVLRLLIELTHQDRAQAVYDMSRSMMRANARAFSIF